MGDEGAASLAAALCHIPELATLNLGGNDLSADGAGLIFSALQHTPLLTALNVSSAPGDEAATRLAAALHHVPLLTSLDAGSCQISDRGAEALGRALPAVPRLVSLDLGNNSVGLGAEALLVGATGLQSLNLMINRLDPAGLGALCRGLRSTPWLTSVDLSWTDLRGGGAQTLARSLSHAPRLVELNISGIGAPLGPDVAGPLSLALQHLSGLTSLHLGYHLFGPAGVAALAAALRLATPRLTSLDLCTNKAGDAGAEAVAEALPHWPRLATLDLGVNGIGDAGAARVADALCRATALTRLSMSDNPLGTAGAGRLLAAQRMATRLDDLRLE